MTKETLLCSYKHKKGGNKCSSVSVKWAMGLMYVRLDNKSDVLKYDTAVQLCVQLERDVLWEHSTIVIVIGLSCQNVDGMNSIDFILTVSRFSIKENLLCENCLYLFSPSPIRRLTMSSVAVGF